MANPTYHIFRKEIREMVRDKRVLTSAFVGPIFLIVVMLVLFGFLEQSLSKPKKQTVQIVASAKSNPTIQRLVDSKVLKIAWVSSRAEGERLIRDGKAELVLDVDDAQDLRISGKVPLVDVGAEPNFRKLVVELPVHEQAAAQERASKAGVTIARGQFFPIVNLTGGVASQGQSWFPSTGRNFVGANLSLPIFNGALNYFNFESAEATSAASSASRESVDRLAVPQLRQAWRAYAEAIEKLKVDRESLEAATVRAEIARAKYQNGLLSFEDWDIIENNLITAQKTALQSELNVNLSEATWLQVQGKGSLS